MENMVFQAAVLGITLGLIGQTTAMAEAQVFTSKEQQTGVIELYTSEGCSSCPPADKWLSKLKEAPELWQGIIPLAFHVDYWDYIGWKDRFAMPEYTLRQRTYARQQSLRTVYTPGFIYNGREWRNWFVKRFFDFPDGGRPGILTLELEDSTANIRFKPRHSSNDHLNYSIALLGFGLKTRIKAGENAGKTLQHDFVVLDINQGAMQDRNDGFAVNVPIPESTIKAARYAVVAWVNSGNDISPIQATGGYLKDSN